MSSAQLQPRPDPRPAQSAKLPLVPGWSPGDKPFAQFSDRAERLAALQRGRGWRIVILISEKMRTAMNNGERARDGGMPYVSVTSEEMQERAEVDEREVQKIVKQALGDGNGHHFERLGKGTSVDGRYRLCFDHLEDAERAAEAARKAQSETLKRRLAAKAAKTEAEVPTLIICPGNHRTITLDQAIQSVRLKNVNLPGFVAEHSVENGEFVCNLRMTNGAYAAPPEPEKAKERRSSANVWTPAETAQTTEKANVERNSANVRSANGPQVVDNTQNAVSSVLAACALSTRRLHCLPDVKQVREISAALDGTPIELFVAECRRDKKLNRPNPDSANGLHSPAYLVYVARAAHRHFLAHPPAPPFKRTASHEPWDDTPPFNRTREWFEEQARRNAIEFPDGDACQE